MTYIFDGIEFKGKKSKDLMLNPHKLGRRQRAEELTYRYEVLDSSTDFIEHTDNYKPYNRKMEFHIIDKTRKDEIFQWLKGYGILRTAIDKMGFFKASVISALEVEDNIGLDKFKVDFLINPPFLYLDSGLTPVTVTSGAKINNPGTYKSEPIIHIIGSGNITLTVNGKTSTITGLVSEIFINTELQHCYNDVADLDGLYKGDYPELTPGDNTISWSGGTVTKVEVIPNWRNL